MALLGDFSKLADAIGKLNNLASPRTFKGIAKNVGQELVVLVGEGFEAQQAPSGAPWARLKSPSKKRGGASSKILQDRGKLRASIHHRLQGDDVLVGTKLFYGTFHQLGTAGRNFVAIHARNQPVGRDGKFLSKAKAARRKAGAITFRQLNYQPGGGAIPARPFLPTDNEALPAKWDGRLAEIIEAELAQLTKGIA